MARSVVCEYERNMSINEETMANVKFLYKYLTLKKVNVKVKAMFVYCDVKDYWNE